MAGRWRYVGGPLAWVTTMKAVPLDLRSLKVFHAVAVTGSMTAAARRLGTTQSAVSQAVRLLEDHLGVRLVDRSQRPLRLTAPGNLLSRRAERLIEESELLTAAVREASALPEFRVGLVDSVAGTLGPELIRRFMDEIATITLWAGLTPPLIHALTNRQLDVVIAAEPLGVDESFRRWRLLREPFVVVVPAALEDDCRTLPLATLAARHPLIRYSARSSLGFQVDLHLRRCGVTALRRVELDSSDTLFAMVAAGVGWAITTPLCVMQARRTDGVAFLPLPGPGAFREVSLFGRAGEYEMLTDRLGALACETLRDDCLPGLRKLMPWLGESFVVAEGVAATT